MAFVSRRVLPSVLHNLLGTLSSRNSDYDGYWIFGLFVEHVSHSVIDLLADQPPASASRSWNAFVRLARHRFDDQVRRRYVVEYIQRAALTFERGGPRLGAVNGTARSGFEVILSAEVISDLGKAYRRQTSFFVAPHDAAIERQSARAAEYVAR